MLVNLYYRRKIQNLKTKILTLILTLMAFSFAENTLSLEANVDGIWNVKIFSDIDVFTINSVSGGEASDVSDNINLPTGKWFYFWNVLLNNYTKAEGKSII